VVETTLEEEMMLAMEEITNMEREFKTLLETTTYLLENQEELQQKYDQENMELEEAKRNATTYMLKYEQLIVSGHPNEKFMSLYVPGSRVG
jgi:regulator of replication initiation timing